MAERLPVTGADLDTWGSILNGFLGVAHNADGTSKAGGASATTLASDSAIGDTTVGVSVLPSGLHVGSYIGIGPVASTFEVRRVTNVSSLTVTLDKALKTTHAAADNVWVCPAVIPVTWYGAKSGGSSFDNETFLQAAYDDSSYHGQILEGFQLQYYTSKPLIFRGEQRANNIYHVAMSSYTPTAANTAMLSMADVATDPFQTVTVTAVDDTFTTSSAHGLTAGTSWVAFKGTMPGGVNAGQRYYVKTTPTGSTFTISATSGGATLDVTSDGSCRVYRNLQALQRWFLHNVRANGNNVAGIGMIANVQQQSESFQVRIESCTAVGAHIYGQDGSWWNTEIINCPTLLIIQNPDGASSNYQRFYQLNLEGTFDVGAKIYGANNVIHDLHMEGGNTNAVCIENHGEGTKLLGDTFMNNALSGQTFFKNVAGDLVVENINSVSGSDTTVKLLDDTLAGDVVLLGDMVGDDPTAPIRLLTTSFTNSPLSGAAYRYLIRGDNGRYMKFGGDLPAAHTFEFKPGSTQTGRQTRWLDTGGSETFAVSAAGYPIFGEGTPIKNVTMGATSVADGGTITHGLGTTPTLVKVTPTVASQMVSVTAVGATTFTVAIKTDAGAAGTTQTVYWEAVKL